MFEGFTHTTIQTSDPEVKINLRYGGKGPGLLLLHGNPLTHVTWHKIAPRLAEHFTVVATDLRGYGDSSKPRGKPDHSNYSFRRMAQDQVEVMEELGFSTFHLVGHDHEGSKARELQRVAVGCSASEHIRAAGIGAIFHDEGRLERCRELGSEEPRDEVGCRARGRRRHEVHRSRRISLRMQRNRDREGETRRYERTPRGPCQWKIENGRAGHSILSP